MIGAGATTLAVGLAGCFGADRTDAPGDAVSLAADEAHQYSSPGCSCCSQYATYLEEHLDGTLSKTTPDDMSAVKRRLSVPDELRSCHTLVIGNYVVEGHVPVSVVAMVLDDEPALTGIALPGMPAGSPGMGGSKRGPFTVHGFTDGLKSGVYAEY